MEHYVTELKTLKELKRMAVEVTYRDILLIYTDDTVYAIQNKCPHQGISLEKGNIQEGVIRCKDHGLPISLKTGEVTSERQANYLRLDRYSRKIHTFDVVIKDEKVYIKV
ncbi:MAG: Rieske 2Fe-2S domain-containing protein [Candidatus Izemoplasma sp.]|nr:Rieske 2Fe-2S domain-containing protein [Candidatus Izemoplasma sp.]